MAHLPVAAPGAVSRVADRAIPAHPSRSRSRRACRSRRFTARVHRRPAADDDVPRRDHRSRAVVLNVPFSLLFGIFTGLVAIVPFFGTLLSTTLPALFVLTGTGYHGFSPLGHALLVVGLGVVVHLIEGNIVSPLVMSKKVDLPPVLTIMSVLVIGQLLGGLGLIVALPTLVRGDGDCAANPDHTDLRRAGIPAHDARASDGPSRSSAGRRRACSSRRPSRCRVVRRARGREEKRLIPGAAAARQRHRAHVLVECLTLAHPIAERCVAGMTHACAQACSLSSCKTPSMSLDSRSRFTVGSGSCFASARVLRHIDLVSDPPSRSRSLARRGAANRRCCSVSPDCCVPTPGKFDGSANAIAR